MLLNASLRLGTNALVAGALRHYDRDAAQSFFENSVGQEVGQYIGDYLGHQVEGLLKKPAPTPLAVAAARDDKEQGGSQKCAYLPAAQRERRIRRPVRQSRAEDVREPRIRTV